MDEYHKLKEMSHAIRDDAKPNEIHLNADETPNHLDPNTLVGSFLFCRSKMANISVVK